MRPTGSTNVGGYNNMAVDSMVPPPYLVPPNPPSSRSTVPELSQVWPLWRRFLASFRSKRSKARVFLQVVEGFTTAMDLRKTSAPGSGIRDPIVLKRSQMTYAMSSEFPGITPLADDVMASVHVHHEIYLDRYLSFPEEVFAKNDSNEGVCRANALVISFHNMLL